NSWLRSPNSTLQASKFNYYTCTARFTPLKKRGKKKKLTNLHFGDELYGRKSVRSRLVDAEELAHGEQVAEPSSSLHVIGRVVEVPAEAAVAQPVQGVHGAAARDVDLHRRRALVAQARRRPGEASPVVHVEPVGEHDLGDHGRVRPDGGEPRRGLGEAARVVGRRRLDRPGRLGARRPVSGDAFLAGLAAVRAAGDDVGRLGGFSGRSLRAFDSLLERAGS
ncbi:Os04g0532700, partial [Oryza sativa Japonica Group]